MNKTFYYHFNPINAWLVLNITLFICLVWCLTCCPCLFYWPQVQVLIGTFVFSLIAWCIKYLGKHKMATLTDESITIDHCAPLYWKDVEKAEERIVRCCLLKRKIIVLLPKADIDYKYNFLQKHNGDFTPFSIPLYDIVTPQDMEEISRIITSKVPFTKLG